MIIYENKNENFPVIPYNLQFFAKNDSGADKTEEATSKKLKDARMDGSVAKSKELSSGIGLASFFFILKVFTGYMGNGFLGNFNKIYSNIDKYAGEEFNSTVAHSLFIEGLTSILLISMPIFIVTFMTGIIVDLIQVKWVVSTKPLQPKLSKINPISGFKKIFSAEKIVELIITILKILVISYMVYNKLEEEWITLTRFYDMNLEQSILLMGNIIIDLGIQISVIFFVIGCADYIYQKIKFKKDMMMTKQEVKDEHKQSEGDPQVKSKIRAKMREVSQRRMMAALPEADVVITNPTHFATAIKYDKEISEAPILIAKGADFLAEKIKEAAKENKIEIVENKPLARMLYYNVEVGDEIPPELYQMAAEVLAYVFELRGAP